MNLPEDFKKVLNSVTNKRARFVIDTILDKGFCSTEDLKNGGYEHAPRAARDVRELGIPLDTFKIKDSNGKNIVAYRITYEIGGDPNDMLDTDYFMLLSPSANRDKSWACEHCINWTEKNITMCQTCYYAYPEKYNHIAGKQERKLNIVFKDDDLNLYNEIVEQAELYNISYQKVAKRMIEYYQQINKKNK